MVVEAMSAYGGLDVLVNNVGWVRPRPDGFLSVTDEDWLSTMTINFFAAVRITRAALPHLLDRGAGTIVTVCSVNAFLPDPLVIDYCAAKAALADFSKALSREVGGRGIRVNTVSPARSRAWQWATMSGLDERAQRPEADVPPDLRPVYCGRRDRRHAGERRGAGAPVPPG